MNYRAFGVRVPAAAKVWWGQDCQEANYEGFVSGCSSLGIAATWAQLALLPQGEQACSRKCQHTCAACLPSHLAVQSCAEGRAKRQRGTQFTRTKQFLALRVCHWELGWSLLCILCSPLEQYLCCLWASLGLILETSITQDICNHTVFMYNIYAQQWAPPNHRPPHSWEALLEETTCFLKVWLRSE